MCPICIGGVMVMASSVMSSGGLTTLAWKKFTTQTDAQRNVRPDAETNSSVTKVEGGKNESTNAGK
jgi:hypothetical protein